MSSSALTVGLRQLRSKLAGQQRDEECDEELLHAFLANHDDDAFAALVRRHGPMVLHVCRRVLGHQQDAEDAFQATFLVLARNAAALRNKATLASFLHGIANRTALKAKQTAVRRRKYEGQAPQRPSTDPADELSWREVRTLLDEEIYRLPGIYRSVFVLCCLEGASREEAARRLGLKEGTVSSRLTTARKRLSQRLARRGVELTVLLAAVELSTQRASAIPAGLMASTIKAVEATVAGQCLDRVVSASVVELVRNVASAAMVSRAKIATVLLLAISMLVGTSVWFGERRGVRPPVGGATGGLTPRRSPEAAKTVEVRGRVLGPDGKPKAGAKLLLLGPLDPGEQQELLLDSRRVRELGVSDADGRFTVAVPKAKMQHYLVAQSENTGVDFFDIYSLKSGKPIEFRLVKDHVIRGRLVNTEGKPVAGVRVAVNHLGIYPNDSLDSFLVFWKNRPFNWGLRGGVKDIWSGAGGVLYTTTDADGRFALQGVGAERLVSLRLSGGGIAVSEVWVANRPGFDPKPYNQATLENLPKGERGFYGRGALSGPDVAIVAEPEKIIRGMVTEADTGKARPGVVVRLTRRNGDDQTGGDYIDLKVGAKTDAQGRYEIHGGRKAKSYLVEVGSDAKTGYLGRAVWAEDTPGYRPVTADIRVRKGVIVTGRMLDKATGKPIEGFVALPDLSDNPFVKEYAEGNFHSILLWAMSIWHTDAEGRFRGVTIPGPVLLMGGPSRRRDEYKNYIPDPDYPQYFEKRGSGYNYSGSGSTIVWGNYCKVLQIKPGTAVVEHDIVLEHRALLGTVKIQDAEGRPLLEVDSWGGATRMEGDTCTIYGEAKDPPRLIVFYEAERKLVGTLAMKAGEKPPPVVRLKPMSSVKGRLLDADGKPLVGIVVAPQYRESMGNAMHSRLHDAWPIASDAEGFFVLDSVIPEMPLELSFRRGRRSFERTTKTPQATIEVKSGDCRDLGAIVLKVGPEKSGE